MRTRIFRLFATGLLLGIVLVCVFFVSGSHQAHAASQVSQAMDQYKVNCKGVTPNYYWWGIEWYVPECAAQQMVDGANLIPTAGPYISALIKAVMNQSCDGSVYVDLVYPAAFASVVRPTC